MSVKSLTLLIVPVLAIALLSAGCATNQGPSRSAYQGAGAGAATGAVAGALLDDDNRWKGGVIGAALGAVLGGTLGEISDRASREAAYTQRPVAYANATGNQRVVAQPYGDQGRCQLVKEKYYENGNLVREVERQVCN